MEKQENDINEKENAVHEFTVEFFGSSVRIDGTVLPLGQVTKWNYSQL